MVYHQLTAFTNRGVYANNHGLVLSADGSKIAFGRPWYGTPRSNLIYSVNYDGTGLTLVDMWEADPGAEVDITSDGSKILSSEQFGSSSVARLVNADGSNPHDVVRLNGFYHQYRLSPDGSTVFLLADRPFDTIPTSGFTREAGLYKMNAAGGGPLPIVTRTSLAAFLGVMPDAVGMGGYGSLVWLAVAGDSTNLLFQAYSGGYRLFGVHADGTGLIEYPLGTEPDVYGFQIKNFGLSGDGKKLFYYLFRSAGGWQEEVGIFNTDGTGPHGLITNTAGLGLSGQIMQMTHDGAKLLLSNKSWLINTDGSGTLEVIGPTHYTEIMRWGFYLGVMNANATRFAYLASMPDGANLQVTTLELNPPSLGLAPPITEASADPPYVVTNGLSSTFLTAHAPTNGLINGFVGVYGYTNGLGESWINQPYLADKGLSGDAQAGDGIYSAWMSFPYPEPIGPRTLRFKTEWQGSDSNYHATVVEIAPFSVVTGTPSGPPPAIASITPSNALPGTQVTINGSGFDPVAANNYVLFGNASAWILSVNPGGTELTVVVPNLQPGSVAVTITAFGQTSNQATFTVTTPSLLVRLTSTNTVVVSWPSRSTGWNLEQNTDVNTTSWASPPETINDDGTNKFIIVNPPTGSRFLRLRRP